jgi:hypothetical protein
MFSGDEWLAGLEPQHGVELCAVVEFMFSLRQLVRVFGEGAFGDRLELVAYNALAAHCRSDMRTHQYHQQVNQVLCSIAHRNWTMSSDDANTFGLEPHFGCCTANLHQGWPKFVGSLWMRSPNGLAVIAYGPNELRTAVEGTTLTVQTLTDYPFNDRVELIIQPAQEHFGDWEVRPRHSWNYGLLVGPGSAGPSGHIKRMPVASPPFFLGKSRHHGAVDYAPVKVTVAGKRVLQWRLVDASAGPGAGKPSRNGHDRRRPSIGSLRMHPDSHCRVSAGDCIIWAVFYRALVRSPRLQRAEAISYERVPNIAERIRPNNFRK